MKIHLVSHVIGDRDPTKGLGVGADARKVLDLQNKHSRHWRVSLDCWISD